MDNKWNEKMGYEYNPEVDLLKLTGDYALQQSELDALRAENVLLRDALRDCEGWIRRYHYEDRPDLADKAKEALK